MPKRAGRIYAVVQIDALWQPCIILLSIQTNMIMQTNKCGIEKSTFNILQTILKVKLTKRKNKTDKLKDNLTHINVCYARPTSGLLRKIRRTIFQLLRKCLRTFVFTVVHTKNHQIYIFETTYSFKIICLLHVCLSPINVH